MSNGRTNTYEYDALLTSLTGASVRKRIRQLRTGRPLPRLLSVSCSLAKTFINYQSEETTGDPIDALRKYSRKKGGDELYLLTDFGDEAKASEEIIPCSRPLGHSGP